MADPYLSSVVLLLHGETGNNTPPVDSSGVSGRTLASQNNSVKVVTSYAKAGTGSLNLDQTTGGNQSHLWTDTSADFATNAQLTYECYWLPSSYVAGGTSYDEIMRVGNIVLAYDHSLNKFQLSDTSRTSVNYGSVNGISYTGTWYHLALTRDSSGNWKFWFNGNLDISPGLVLASYETATGAAQLGTATTGFNAATFFYDEVRFTKGVARYTANFTPPSVPFDTPAGGSSSSTADSLWSSVALLIEPHPIRKIVDDSPLLLRTAVVNGAYSLVTNSDFPDGAIYNSGSVSCDIDCVSNSVLNISGAFTLEWEAKYATLPAGTQLFTFADNAAATGRWLLYIANSGAAVLNLNWYGGAEYVLSGTTVVPTGSLVRIGVSRDASGNIRAWFNGTYVGTQNFSTAIGNGRGVIKLQVPPGAYLGRVRLTVGTARMTGTASYTPSSGAYAKAARISGTVTDDTNAGAVRYLLALDRSTGRIDAGAISAANGSYILNTASTNEHDVIALDDTAGTVYNDLIGRVIPA